MSRTAIARLSTEHLLHNLQVIRAQAPNSGLIAMVKANAYGHGLRQTSLRLAPHVDLLGVASIDEALALRAAGVQIPILLMEGVFFADELEIAAEKNFQVVFHGEHQIAWLKDIDLARPLCAWLKVDTGMGRLGFRLENLHHAHRDLVATQKLLEPPRLMSHFACADNTAHAMNARQSKAFRSQVAPLGEIRSLCNSAGIFAFPEDHYEFVRTGIALYGVSPYQGVSAKTLGLKPVMTLESSLIALKDLQAGDSLGYGARFVCERQKRVGLVAFGYGDGYPQSAPDGTSVLVNGQLCPLIGRVSMDMMTVDLSLAPSARVGDPVCLWGEGLAIETVAEQTKHSVYTLLTGVLNRVRFQWTDIREQEQNMAIG